MDNVINLMSINLNEKSIGKELLDKGVISTYFHAASSRFGVDPEDSRIFEFNWSIGLTNRYDRICDLNTFPSLSREILEKMRPYEGMALKLGERKTNYPIADYETEKRNYLNNIRFWNYILDTYGINAMYFWKMPHHQMEYVIYALARIKEIPMIVQQNTSIPEVGEYSSSIETAGENIGRYFERDKTAAGESRELIGPVLDFFNEEIKSNDERNRERKKTNFQKKQLKQQMRGIFDRGIGGLAWKRFIHQHIKYLLGAVYSEKKNWIPIDRKDLLLEKQQRIMIRNFMRNRICRMKEYNRNAIEPDYSVKYIYFALQLTPELTTMPQAGVFAEQYTTIQLLARAAEKSGVLVYVKEHFVQPFRERDIYEMISSIPNVRMIKSTVSSFDLITHSVAVSTQTGTCILEGAFRGKPALITGGGYNWRGLPGCFLINDEEQCEQIIKDILAGVIKPVTREELIDYLYAVQKKTVYMHEEGVFHSDELMEKSYRMAYKLISSWIKSGFDLMAVEDCLI